MARPLIITAYGNAQVDTSIVKYGSGSLQLDGSGDYLLTSAGSGTFDWPSTAGGGFGNLTCGFWIYPTSSSAGTIISGTGSSPWRFGVTSGQKLTVTVAGQTYNDTSTGVTLNAWNHIAFTYNDTSTLLQMFVNGTRGYAQAIGQPVTFGGENLYIGSTNSSSGFFTGYIDDFRCTNQVESRLVGGLTIIDVPTTFYTSLIDDSARDRTLLLVRCDGSDGSTSFEDISADLLIAGSVQDGFATLSIIGNYITRGSANLSAFASQLTVQNPAPNMVYLQNDAYTWADTDTWDTIYDSDDKWAVWERLNTSFAITAIGSDFDIASSSILFEASLTVTGGIQRNGTADLTSTASLTAKGGFLIGIDDPYDYTWETVPDDQWNGFFTDQWRPNGWFAFDQVTLTGVGGLQLAGQADLTTSADIAVDARLSDVRGSADLAGEFALESGSDNFKDGAATLEAFATEVTVGRLSDVRASAELVSQFTLTSGSDNFKDGLATLEAQALLTSSSAVTLVNSADLDAVFAVDANSRILKLANLDITSLGDMSVSAVMILNAGTNLASEFTQTLNAGYSLSGSANLAAEFTEIVRPTLIPSVELGELTATASLTVNGQMTYGGVAILEAFAAEITTGERVQGGKANLEAEFTTVVTGSATLAGSARLDAFVAQLTDGRISTTRGSATLAGTFVSEFAGELKLLDSQFIYRVLHDTRKFAVEDEQRKYDVLSENRTFDIDPESRGYQVLPENRTVEVGYFMQ